MGCSPNEPDVCNGKAEDKCPYHAQSEFNVSIDDICVIMKVVC